MLPVGTYAAVAVPVQSDAGEVTCQFGESKDKGTPFAAVAVQVIRGPHARQRITWQGYFSGGATEHTIKALRNFGFSGDDLASFPAQRPENEVEIVVKHEVNNDGKSFAKVAWVNSPNRGMKISAPIQGSELRKFSAQFKAHLKSAPVIAGTKAVLEEPSSTSTEGGDFDQSSQSIGSETESSVPPPDNSDDIPF